MFASCLTAPIPTPNPKPTLPAYIAQFGTLRPTSLTEIFQLKVNWPWLKVFCKKVKISLVVFGFILFICGFSILVFQLGFGLNGKRREGLWLGLQGFY